ncbi:MAG: DUF362 domain-containing protein [Candidatus Goldbacteria bacterium]|nr:DUF362 domain-containing protein [Candidatus Goldiibacteriota bacterium]
MNRRKFLKETLKYSLTASIALTGVDKLFAAGETLVKDSMIKTPDLIAIKGSTPGKMFEKGIMAMGGMTKFVKKGQKVLVKPNIGWDVAPGLAANTNPELVSTIIRHCYDAGAKKVCVFDHPCDNWQKTYKNSGIEYAVKQAGGIMAPGSSKSDYQKVNVPGGKTLKSADVHELLISSDVFINVPILKNHGSTKITIGMKNLMGCVWDRRYWHITNLQQCIADFAAYRKPDLTVVDAYNVMVENGPRGTGSSDVVKMQSQIISTDIVAADAAATKIFGMEPSDIKYIKMADEKGLGNLNLDKINVKKIYL